jgi:hypothetical protein
LARSFRESLRTFLTGIRTGRAVRHRIEADHRPLKRIPVLGEKKSMAGTGIPGSI